jgi:hypothetical protein
MSNYPVFFEGGAMVLGSKEKEFLESFITTGDADQACGHSGMTLAQAREFMGSDRIKRYIAHKIEQVGRRNDVTMETVMDRLHRVAWGEIKITRYEMKALEILASYLGILKPSVQVAVGVKIDSPLASVTDANLDAMLAERIGVNPSPAQ